jgi:hypothetical protein
VAEQRGSGGEGPDGEQPREYEHAHPRGRELSDEKPSRWAYSDHSGVGTVVNPIAIVNVAATAQKPKRRWEGDGCSVVAIAIPRFAAVTVPAYVAAPEASLVSSGPGW